LDIGGLLRLVVDVWKAPYAHRFPFAIALEFPGR
jgi:hypothetical protein